MQNENIKSVNIDTAKSLVKASAVTRASIELIDNHTWAIFLRGSADFQLKSERKNPKMYKKLETALQEIRNLGLRSAEIKFERFDI